MQNLLKLQQVVRRVTIQL